MRKPKPFMIGKKQIAFCCPGNFKLEDGTYPHPVIVLNEVADIDADTAGFFAAWLTEASYWLAMKEEVWSGTNKKGK